MKSLKIHNNPPKKIDLNKKTSIHALSFENWKDYMASLGHKPYRAKQVQEWLYNKNVRSINEMINIPLSLRDAIQNDFLWHGLHLIEKRKSSLDQSEKYLWQIETANGPAFVESVLIFSGKRATSCLSSQIGCRVGCSFCSTARIQPVIQLPAWAIVEQHWRMIQESGLVKIDNAVFMGMGEPFHNYRASLWAAYRLTDHPGFFLHPKRITISTSGILPIMEKYLREKHPFGRAISLNAPDSKRRAQIIPNEKRWPIQKLIDFAKRYYQQHKKRITFEYVMIKDFNDFPEDGILLGRMFSHIPVKINLIPYNATNLGYSAPLDEKLDIFIQGFLNETRKTGKHSVITLRRSAGSDIDGACGQLAGKAIL